MGQILFVSTSFIDFFLYQALKHLYYRYYEAQMYSELSVSYRRISDFLDLLSCYSQREEIGILLNSNVT